MMIKFLKSLFKSKEEKEINNLCNEILAGHKELEKSLNKMKNFK